MNFFFREKIAMSFIPIRVDALVKKLKNDYMDKKSTPYPCVFVEQRKNILFEKLIQSFLWTPTPTAATLPTPKRANTEIGMHLKPIATMHNIFHYHL